jgi:hypothetical protein
MLSSEILTNILKLILSLYVTQSAMAASAFGEAAPEVCKITFKTNPNEVPASCTASYLGRGYFVTDRHCLLAPQTEPHVYNNNDLSVDPKTVVLACTDQTLKLNILDAYMARDMDDSEDGNLDTGSQLTVRDLLVFKMPHFRTKLSPIRLFGSFADFPGFTSATSAWYTSYGTSRDEKYNLKLHSFIVPNLENFSILFQSPLYGVLSYKGRIASPGDSGGPLTVNYNGNQWVLGFVLGYCESAECGGGHDYYSIVTWTILKNRFSMIKDSAFHELLYR